MKKYVETVVTVDISEISAEMTDEEMKEFKNEIDEFKYRVKKTIERTICDRISSNPDLMKVKVQVFLHDE